MVALVILVIASTKRGILAEGEAISIFETQASNGGLLHPISLPALVFAMTVFLCVIVGTERGFLRDGRSNLIFET